MIALGVMEFFLMGANQEHPAYFIAVLVAIGIIIAVFLCNKKDANSWWYGVLTTLWQSLVFLIIIYALIGLSNATKKKNG